MDKLGGFKISSEKVMVTDPCYDRGTWCQVELNDVLTGNWVAYAVTRPQGGWGTRVCELHAYHEDVVVHPERPEEGTLIWEEVNGEVGVDSGQAGIFDERFYRDDSVVEEDPEFSCGDEDGERWYSMCCDITLDESRGGVIPYGAVSSSGFGDGGYECLVHRPQTGKIDAIKIIFIRENDDEDFEIDDDTVRNEEAEGEAASS